eukprot:2850044-Pleurochrysis_carterae.AAC.1
MSSHMLDAMMMMCHVIYNVLISQIVILASSVRLSLIMGRFLRANRLLTNFILRPQAKRLSQTTNGMQKQR